MNTKLKIIHDTIFEIFQVGYNGKDDIKTAYDKYWNEINKISEKR